jgi:photosystem II stability/assembly factor-like uncharacterized protein
VDNVVVDRASPNRVLVSGASGDITLPTDKWTRQTFITEDWGVTWNAVDLPPRASIEIGQTAILVDDAATIYVPTDTQILWRSTDWGRSWKKGADFAARRLAGLTTLGSHRPGELFVWPWRTLDGGASWHDLPIPQVPAFEPALAAGNGKLLGLTGTGFMTSTNAGATWRSSPVGPDAGNRSILEFLVQSPVEPRPLWAGGFFESTTASVYPALRSVDGGLTWTPINTVGGVFLWDGASADVAFSLPGEDIQRTEDGGLTWQTVTLPGASYRVLAAGACAPPLSCLYGLFMDEGNGEITTARTDDHGDTWTPPQLIPRSLGFVGFPGPLTVFPHDPQRLLVPCDRRLCESQDGGATWTYSALPGVSIEFLENGAILSATGGISRSDDGGVTWTPVLNAVGALVPSRTHPDTVFLIPDPTIPSTARLMRSDDAGSTWRSAVPDAAATWTVVAVTDAPDGRFLALIRDYGLVTFD